MDTLIIIVLVLVGILSLIYLIRNNSLENNLIEKFSERNSLSTYFQPTENSSELIDKIYSKNSYNNTNKDIQEIDYSILKNNIWNGFWSDKTDDPLYAVFLIVNDKIIFSISKSSFEIDSPFQPSGNEKCISNVFVGIGSLNTSKNKFILRDILCNNLDDNNYVFSIDQTSGYLNGQECTIYTSDGISSLTLNKSGDFEYSKQSAYLFLSSYINPIPNFKDKYKGDTDVCRNSTFGSNTEKLKACYINDKGLPVPNNVGVRKYGTGCSTEISEENNGDATYNSCSTDVSKTCFIPGKTTQSVGDYPICDTEFIIKRDYQSNIGYGLTKLGTNGNNLKLCSYLDNFYNTLNSAIIMYVEDLTTVQTLGYNYFGQTNNTLTSNIDIMKIWMETNILKKLREDIMDDSSSNSELEKALRMTNCIENNNADNTYDQLLEICKTEVDQGLKQIDEFKKKRNESIKSNIHDRRSNRRSDIRSGNSLSDTRPDIIDEEDEANMPVVWKLNMSNNTTGNYNNQNSCTFSLSTSEWYIKESRWVKYAEFDPVNNKTGVGLYKGGPNQQLFLENAFEIGSYIDDTGDTGSDIIGNYTILTGNLRTSNPKKYLIPSSTYSGFGQKSTSINLENRPKNNGKWVILGFSLMKNMDTISPTSLNNKILIKTLAELKKNLITL